MIVQKIGALQLDSPQIAQRREMPADGQNYIVGQGGALKAGDTVQARAALERQLAVWKDADVDFPDLVETRRLLTRLTTTR